MKLYEKIHTYLFNASDSLDDSFHLSLALNHLSFYFDEFFPFQSLDSLIIFIDDYIFSYLEDTNELHLYLSIKDSLIKDISDIFNTHNRFEN